MKQRNAESRVDRTAPASQGQTDERLKSVERTETGVEAEETGRVSAQVPRGEARQATHGMPVTHTPLTDEQYARIAERAYTRFIERGGEHGYHLEDWLEAERDVRSATSGDATRDELLHQQEVLDAPAPTATATLRAATEVPSDARGSAPRGGSSPRGRTRAEATRNDHQPARRDDRVVARADY